MSMHAMNLSTKALANPMKNNCYTKSVLAAVTVAGLIFSSTAAHADTTHTTENEEATIVWVTRDRDAVPADWLPILTNAGYNVTHFTGGLTPTESEVDELNAADLVIFDNSHGSVDAGDRDTWNALSVPLLTMANYPLNNWHLTSGSPPNKFDQRPPVFFPDDLTWTGVTLPLEEDIFTSVRGASANIQHDGVILAGEEDRSAMYIARWGAITDGGGARLYFSGTRTGGDNDSMHLTALGQTVWLNAIDSLINPPAAPVLLVTEPEHNAEDVIVLPDLRLTFDRQVQAGTGNISLYTSDDTLVESFDVETSERVTFGLVTVTITPTAPLPFDTTYYVLIDATAIESVGDGSPFAGISDPMAWRFTTNTTENDQYTIVWVTRDRDVVPTDWWSILIIAGYNVTAFTGGLTPTASEVDELNAADLVIFDNTHGSVNAGDAATWNALSVPLLTMANYPLNNWGLTSGNPQNKFDQRPPVFFPADPIWTGVTLPLEQNIFTSVRGANGNIQHGGLILAGEEDRSAMYIARWAPGAITAGGGARLYFAGVRTGGDDDSMHLTALGQTVWLNAVDSLINPPAAPLLMMTAPKNNAEDVIVFNDLSLTFDRLVQAGTGNIALYTSDDTLVESFDVETSGRLSFDLGTVTIDPTAALEVGTTFYVLIDATAIESVDDGTPFVGISDPTAWRFTTDGTPPEDITLWPWNGAINIQPDIDLEIDFDENVMAGSGNITVHCMSDDSVVETIDVATAAISGSHVTLTLSEPLANSTAYYVNAPVGVFTDLSGNAWAGKSGSDAWTFSTTFAPVVTYTSDGTRYVAHIFTEDDVFYPPAELDVEVLVVGGGGGGGSSQGLSSAGAGAGGAGGLVFTNLSVSGPVSVIVGRGGAGGGEAGVDQSARGGDGASSYFGTIRALGGGGGPGADAGGNHGGSGSGRRNNAPGQAYQPLSTSGGFGHAGGGGATGGGGSGGGGAGGPGVDLAGDAGSDGGAGMQFDIAGTPSWFAAGGGGGGRADAAMGLGGSGIGGNGANNDTASTPGGAHTGSGGGGGNNSQPGSDGGSGIVIVRYVEEGFYGLRATDILDVAADLHATLNAADRTVEVTLYWSTANNANAAAWEADATKESVVVGLFTDAVREPLTAAAAGLSADTPYYYTFHAVDAVTNDEIWSPTARFETVSTVLTPVLANPGVTNVGPFTARLQGQMTVGGTAEAYVVWGASAPDPADGIDAWDHVVSIGTILPGDVFTTTLTGLAAGQTHHVRVYATNPAGAGWSDTARFTTPVSKVTWNGSDDFADMLALLEDHITWSVPAIDLYQEFAVLEAAEALRVATLESPNDYRETLADVGQRLDALQLRDLLASSQLDHNLAAYKILSDATPAALNQFAEQSPGHADLLMQLFSDTDLMVQMVSPYGARGGQYGVAMEIYDAIQQASPRASEGVFQRMAVAVSLVFADPGAPDFVDPVQRYLSYEQWFLNGELDPAFEELSTWDLTYAINMDVPDEILAWGREMLRTYRPDLIERDLEDGRYVVSVNTEIFYGSTQLDRDRDDLNRYQNILANGGQCGRRAAFGRFIMRSFGIPAIRRPEPGHASMAYWTSNGWQTRLGGSWGGRAWMTIYGERTHNRNFLAMTDARKSAEGFPQVERAQWIGALMGEAWNIGLYGRGGAGSSPTMCETMGPWHALSLIRQYEVIEDLKDQAEAAGEVFNWASQLRGYIDYPHYEVPEADREVVVDPDGVITIPAAAAQLPEDNVAWGGEVREHVALRLMESNLGGAQLHYGRYSGGKQFSYTIEVPVSRSYALHARAATVGSHAEDPSWPSALAVTVNDAPDVEMPLPYTMGLWGKSEPIEIELSEGTNTLVFRRTEGKGITIRDFTLMPVTGEGDVVVTIDCSQSGSIVYGTPTTFTAAVSVSGGDGPATGMVSFLDGATVLGGAELVDGTATFETSKLPVGSLSVVAFYGGDETFASSSSDPVVLTVTAKPVSLSGVEAVDKIYDGTTAATLEGGTLSGVLEGDAVSVSLSGSFDTADVGVGKSVTSSTTLAGAQAGNYTLTQPEGLSATILSAPLTVAATDHQKDYGVALELGPGSTAFSAEGLIEGETIGSVTLHSAGAAAEAVPGDYPITPSAATGGTFDPENYDIQYEDGTLEVVDADPPTPDPMYFAVAPHVLDYQSITMTATTATDAFSEPVSYLFENVTAETSSGWISATVWTDTGLASGVPYSFRVKARDAVGNETGWSPESSATIPSVVNFAPVSGAGPESTSPVSVTVTLSAEHTDTVTVEHRLATPGGTATPGVDFVYSPGSLVFEPGQTSRQFTFEVIDDDEAKADLTVVFELGEITNGLAGADTTFTYTIEADEDDWFTVPFRDDFEDRERGNLHGQFGWVAEGTQVQSDVTYGESGLAASITEDEGFMRRTFNDGSMQVWTDLRIRPQPMAEVDDAPQLSAGDTVGIFVSTDLEVMVYDGAAIKASGLTVPEDDWVRITIFSDYDTGTWRLFVDGVHAGPFDFHTTGTAAYSAFGVEGKGAFVDDVAITLDAPDAHFTLHALTVNSGSGSGLYMAGTEVAIVADAATEGQVFDAWTGDTAGIEDVNSVSTTLTMPAAAVEVTATYRDESPPIDDLYEYALDNREPAAGVEDGLLVYSYRMRNNDARIVYLLQSRDSLVLGEWQDSGLVPNEIINTGTVFDEVIYRIPMEEAVRFFRLRIYLDDN